MASTYGIGLASGALADVISDYFKEKGEYAEKRPDIEFKRFQNQQAINMAPLEMEAKQLGLQGERFKIGTQPEAFKTEQQLKQAQINEILYRMMNPTPREFTSQPYTERGGQLVPTPGWEGPPDTPDRQRIAEQRLRQSNYNTIYDAWKEAHPEGGEPSLVLQSQWMQRAGYDPMDIAQHITIPEARQKSLEERQEARDLKIDERAEKRTQDAETRQEARLEAARVKSLGDDARKQAKSVVDNTFLNIRGMTFNYLTGSAAEKQKKYQWLLHKATNEELIARNLPPQFKDEPPPPGLDLDILEAQAGEGIFSAIGNTFRRFLRFFTGEPKKQELPIPGGTPSTPDNDPLGVRPNAPR